MSPITFHLSKLKILDNLKELRSFVKLVLPLSFAFAKTFSGTSHHLQIFILQDASIHNKIFISKNKTDSGSYKLCLCHF